MRIVKGILQTSLTGALFSLSLTSQAASLGLTPSYPDFGLTSDQIFTYDANCDGDFTGLCSSGQGMLTVNGTVASYTESGPGGVIENATVRGESPFLGEGSGVDAFSLTAVIDIVTGSVVSGSFTLDGIVVDPASFPNALLNGDGQAYSSFEHASGNLYSGDLALFGFSGNSAPSTGGIIEFTFDNAGGLLADPNFNLIELGAFASQRGGMILTVNTTTLGEGNFGSNLLTNDWTGTGLGDVFVPVPAAIWLFGSGLVTLFGFARARQNRA